MPGVKSRSNHLYCSGSWRGDFRFWTLHIGVRNMALEFRIAVLLSGVYRTCQREQGGGDRLRLGQGHRPRGVHRAGHDGKNAAARHFRLGARA